MANTRLLIPTEFLIEVGPNREQVIIKAVNFSDYDYKKGEHPLFGDLTKGGTDFSGYKPTRWAVLNESNCALNKKTGKFDYQPLSSSRTDKFLNDHRFETMEEALECYITFYEKVSPFQNSIERQLEFEKTLK